MLRPRGRWFLAGFVGIEILLVLSFILVPRFSNFANEDLLAHFAAYCVLCLWFLLACRTPFERRSVVLCFLALACGTEYLQSLTLYHIFDWRDVASNLAGVFAAQRLSRLRRFSSDRSAVLAAVREAAVGRERGMSEGRHLSGTAFIETTKESTT